MNKLFVHFKTKAGFLAAVSNKPEEMNEYWNSIVFISNTQEIYTHGVYYAIPDYWKDEITKLKTNVEKLSADLAEEIKNYVHWSDEYKNRIVLPYVTEANRPNAGEGAGQIIAYANPNCKEGGSPWDDKWKEQETTSAYKAKYPDAVSPNVYKEKAPAVVLAQMSKYNVQEYGSQSYPINLQGSKVRPTYNDDEQIALLSDVEAAVKKIMTGGTNEEINKAYDTLIEIAKWIEEHGDAASDLTQQITEILEKFDSYYTKAETQQEIQDSLENYYTKDELTGINGILTWAELD